MKAASLYKVLLSMFLLGGVSAVAQVPQCFPLLEPPIIIVGEYEWNSNYGAIQSKCQEGGFGCYLRIEFPWPAQTNVQAFANCVCGFLSFDIFVNDDSFLYGAWTNGAWYQIHYIGNSDGGWRPGGYVSETYNTEGSNDHFWHFKVPLQDLGWMPGTTWFQLFFTANSDPDKVVQYFVDNVCIELRASLEISRLGQDVVLNWTNALWSLESSGSARGPFEVIQGATSPYTNQISGEQQFFRLKY